MTKSGFIISFIIIMLTLQFSCKTFINSSRNIEKMETESTDSKKRIVQVDILQFQTDNVFKKSDLRNKFIYRLWHNDSIYEQEDFWDFNYINKYLHKSDGKIYGIFDKDTFLYFNPITRNEKIMCINIGKDSYPWLGFVVDSIKIDRDEMVYIVEFIQNISRDTSELDFKWNIGQFHLRFIIHPKLGIIAEKEIRNFHYPPIQFKKDEEFDAYINIYRLVYYKTDTTDIYYNFDLPKSWKSLFNDDYDYYWKEH